MFTPGSALLVILSREAAGSVRSHFRFLVSTLAKLVRMTPERIPERIAVSLPCHSLHDFPTWLDEAEADALLSAWTSAWHPWLIASIGVVPRWASVDLPPTDDATLGIVPAPWDDRFAAQADTVCTSNSSWVRGITDRNAIVSAAAAALAGDQPVAASLPGDHLAEEFYALGLAALLAELLAQRMRSSSGLMETGFADAAVRAARAVIEGGDQAARDSLRECYSFLEATRAHYYPVDVWFLDLVLLAESTLGDGLDQDLRAPVPSALVATGRVIEQLAVRNPAALSRLRERCTAGTLAPVGGRYDAQPLDECTPEEILRSFERGLAVWRDTVGTVPVTYAQQTGGASALLPQLLSGLGYSGVIWTLFDGTRLPDPASSRIRWEGTGGGCIDGVARPPLDARSAQAILSLPERIGDAMDHDHTAVIQWAHHAGTASPWFNTLRQIGAASTVLGTFVTPPEFFNRTAGAGTVVSFEPDLFPVGLSTTAAVGEDPVFTRLTAARDEARRLMTARESLQDALPRPSLPAPAPVTGSPGRAHRSPWGFSGLFATTRQDDAYVLEHAMLRVAVHPQTGGVLAVRRPVDRSNRLSQRLAARTTRPPPPPGQPWEDATERAVYSGMLADSIEREPATQDRGETIVSRGRLVSAQQRLEGSFTQRVQLVAGLPLALIDVDVRLTNRPQEPLFEHHAACRFAWNENEDVDVRRSLHTQAVATERGRFTAPWFIEVGRGAEREDRVTILTGGLPWHLRTTPHMLDSILPHSMLDNAACRLAVGIGLDRPWDLAAAVLADRGSPAILQSVAQPGVPTNVRLTTGSVHYDGAGRLAAARIGLLESDGRSGEVRLEWATDVARASVCDPSGLRTSTAGSTADGVTIDGRGVVLYLRRYQWLHLTVEFCS